VFGAFFLVREFTAKAGEGVEQWGMNARHRVYRYDGLRASELLSNPTLTKANCSVPGGMTCAFYTTD
jgi:hypothetical protein